MKWVNFSEKLYVKCISSNGFLSERDEPEKFKKPYRVQKQVESDLNCSLDVGYLSTLRTFIAKEVAKDIIHLTLRTIKPLKFSKSDLIGSDLATINGTKKLQKIKNTKR